MTGEHSMPSQRDRTIDIQNGSIMVPKVSPRSRACYVSEVK